MLEQLLRALLEIKEALRASRDQDPKRRMCRALLKVIRVLIRTSDEMRECVGNPVPLMEVLIHDMELLSDSRVERLQDRFRGSDLQEWDPGLLNDEKEIGEASIVLGRDGRSNTGSRKQSKECVRKVQGRERLGASATG
jgi:hypothetical protein